MVLLFLGDIGGGEIALVALVALVVLGPQRFPEIARKMGQLMGQFRRASTDLQRQLNNELRDVDGPKDPASPSFGDKAAAWATRLKADISSAVADPSAPKPPVEVETSRPPVPGALDLGVPFAMPEPTVAPVHPQKAAELTPPTEPTEPTEPAPASAPGDAAPASEPTDAKPPEAPIG